jgi:hypothetical protein
MSNETNLILVDQIEPLILTHKELASKLDQLERKIAGHDHS